MNSGFSGYTVFVPELPEDIPSEMAVKGGMSAKVPVEYGEVRRVVLPNGAAGSLTSKVIVPDYVYAPVEKNSKVGEIHFIRNDKVIFTVDIIASESAEEMTVLNAVSILLKNLLTF